MSSDETLVVVSNDKEAWAELKKGKAFRANTDFLYFDNGMCLNFV